MSLHALHAAILLVTLAAPAESGSPHASAMDFVRNFYDWYAPFAQREHQSPAFVLALKRNFSLFSPELQKALLADAAAQSKVHGEIVGLDFDPFLFSQDPDERYELGKVTHDGPHLFLTMHGVSHGKKRSQPSVRAEVCRESDHWVFVNFHSPEGSDLLTTLKALEESRRAAQHSR